MRILIVHNRYRYRGGEDECCDTEHALLRQNGHELCQYLQDNSELEGLSGYAAFRTGFQVSWNHEQYKTLRQLFREQRPNVVHVHNFFPLISPAVHYAASAEGIPVVQTLHNYRLICPGANLYRDGQVCETCVQKRVPWPALQHGCYRGDRAASGAVVLMEAAHRLLRTWQRKVSFFITPSEFARRKFIEAGFPAHKLLTKPNCVYPEPKPREGTRTYAAFVGRLSVEKGIRTLLSAWKLLRRRIPLRIVGDGPLAVEVAAAAQQLPGVEWLGHRSLEEAHKVMADAMFLVVPSESYETFGRATVEGFAHGTPVIASNLGATAEIVSPCHTGLHIAPGNAGDLAAKLDWACSHPHAMAEMGRNARREYETKYTAARNYELLMNIYRKAIESSSCRFQEEQGGTSELELRKEIVA